MSREKAVEIVDVYASSLSEIALLEKEVRASAEPNNAIIRMSIPAGLINTASMFEEGYVFADRTIGVRVKLRKKDIENLLSDQRTRVEIRQVKCLDEAMESLAYESFEQDSRFRIILRNVTSSHCVKNDTEIQKTLIAHHLAHNTLVFYEAFYKDFPVGFLVLKQDESSAPFIHLAAVDPKYSLTGAAIELYQHAMAESLRAGAKVLEGRISSTNMAVMNLYSSLGGTFVEPMDVYFKEVGNGSV